MNTTPELKLKANEFYYKNIWNRDSLVCAYIDNNGNFTTKRTAFYVGTFTSADVPEAEDFYVKVNNRLKEHQEEYQVPGARSSLGGYVDQMRRTVEDWKK